VIWVNLIAYSAQVFLLVVLCGGLPRLLRLIAPAVQLAFWRTLLGVCLALPLVEPWAPPRAVSTRLELLQKAPQPFTLLPDVQFDPHFQVRFSYAVFAVLGMVIAAGIAIRIGWLLCGLWRLRQLRRGATGEATGFEDLQDLIGAACPILWSPDVRHPVAFGIRRPVILLPCSLQEAAPVARRAVVAHELHHVKRRDWGWILLEEVIRSVFWFHPAMWWLVSRVQLARETVVDELSILVSTARRAYLDALLTFADDSRLGSPAFSARRHLFHRVMLLSQEGGMSSIRVAFASCLLMIALAGASIGAVAAFPLYGNAVAARPPRQAVQIGIPPSTDDEFRVAVARMNPLRIGGAVKAPLKVRDVKPVYPSDAQADGVTGVVIVEILVDTEGAVSDVHLLRSIPPLDQAAVDAVRQWKFMPTLLNGEPQNVQMTVTINFTL